MCLSSKAISQHEVKSLSAVVERGSYKSCNTKSVHGQKWGQGHSLGVDVNDQLCVLNVNAYIKDNSILGSVIKMLSNGNH